MADIVSYYGHAQRQARALIDKVSDREGATCDPEDWIRRLVDEFLLLPIEPDPSRQEEMVEVGDQVVSVMQPILPNPTMTKYVGRLGCSRMFMSHSLDEIQYDSSRSCIIFSCHYQGLGQMKSFVRDACSAWSEDIKYQNTLFPSMVRGWVERRVADAKAKRASFEEFVQTSGIKLIRKAEDSSIVPIAVPVRKEVREVLRRVQAEERLTLDDETLKAIITLIDNQGLQFERTPSAFAHLMEENLRDIVLSSLNGVFGDKALGEAFQGIGKADIHLRVAKGDLFIAECKRWEGEGSLAEVTAQLLDRLTWHESYGVVLMFNYDRTDFGNILAVIKDSVPKLPGALGGLRVVDKHHFACTFRLPSDSTRKVEVRFLAYNLYVPRPSRRSKTKKSAIPNP